MCSSGSQSLQKGDQVTLLRHREADAETRVVGGDGLVETGGEAVVEVRRTRRQGTQRRALEAADVLRRVGPAAIVVARDGAR